MSANKDRADEQGPDLGPTIIHLPTEADPDLSSIPEGDEDNEKPGSDDTPEPGHDINP